MTAIGQRLIALGHICADCHSVSLPRTSTTVRTMNGGRLLRFRLELELGDFLVIDSTRSDRVSCTFWMNGDASSVFMNSVSAWMSTVWPTMRNFVSARCWRARSRRAPSFPPLLASFAPCTGRLASDGVRHCRAGRRAGLRDEVSHVYCGSALLISSSRCGQR